MPTLSRIIVSFMAIAVIALGVSSVAQAQATPPITDEIRQKIVTNCVSIKNTLSQLHASDALLRVNRGQAYESMATKVMDNFNDRLSSNHLDNKATTTVTGQYRTALATFRTDYIAYEQKLSEALKMNCAARPDQFYETVGEARALRTIVHEDVQKLHRVLDDYRSSVGDFSLNYDRISQ